MAALTQGGLVMEWKGLDECARAMAALPVQFERRLLRRGLVAGAMVYRDGMSERAPERTGALRAGIGFVVTVSPRVGAVAKVGPQAPVFYGGFVELGTRFQSPRPFMRPTMYADGPIAIAAMVHAWRDGWEGLLKGLGPTRASGLGIAA